jgi:LuxR family maltose regulon positive regulatory protein
MATVIQINQRAPVTMGKETRHAELGDSRATIAVPEVLPAKLRLPQQGFLLPRPRLAAAMPSSRTGGLVSVVAGPGYGKTAFVAEVLSTPGVPRAYYALDDEDRDPARFLDLLITSFDHMHRGVGRMARERLDESRDAGRESLAVMAALLETLPGLPSTPSIVVLEDVHAVEDSEAVMAAIEFMLDGLPSGWTLLLSSRHRMPLALDRHVTRGRGVEIGLRRLRLTPSEVREWARELWEMELGLPEARSIWKLTEGWPVALVLLGQRFRHARRIDVHQDVTRLLRQGKNLNDYLASDVFNTLTLDESRSLLACAPLSRVIFPRDEPFMDEHAPGAESVLADMVDRGFLVTETGHRTFTLHPLVRAFADEAARTENPLNARLHALSAAKHLESVGCEREAVELYLKNGDARDAVPALRTLASGTSNPSTTDAFAGWLDLIPPEAFPDEPWLLFARARALQGQGSYLEAEPAYSQAARRFEGDHDLSAALGARLGQAFCLYLCGRWDDCLEALKRAQSSARASNERSEVFTASGTVLLSQCRWDEAVENFELALVTADPEDRRLLEPRIHAHRARLFFLRGEYGTSLQWARKAAALGAGGSRAFYATALNVLATALYSTGRYDEAAIQAEAALTLVRARGYAYLEAPVLLSSGAIAQGRHELRSAVLDIRRAQALSHAAGDVEAEVWATDMLADLSRRNRNPARGVALHTQAMEVIDLHQLAAYERVRVCCGIGMDLAVMGRNAAAAEMLESVLRDARRLNFAALLSQSLFYLGWLAALQGDEHRALRSLREAFSLASTHEQLHFFVQEAPVALPILALADRMEASDYPRKAVLPRLASRFRAAFEELADGRSYPTDRDLGAPGGSRLRGPALTAERPADPSGARAAALVELLTERELEILHMIALGMPNKVIGMKLAITEKTIKTHTNRIFRKLEVTNRLQAVLVLQEFQRAHQPRGGQGRGHS